MHDASHLPTEAQEDNQRATSLTKERCQEINDELRLPQDGLAVAQNYPPDRCEPALTIVKLPRGTAGKPARRGVHVPLSSFAAVKANTRIHGRKVVNPPHQRPYLKRRNRK